MSERRGLVSRHLVPLVVAAAFLLPLLWMITASLRGPGLAPPSTIEWIPPAATSANYGTVFELLPFGRYLLNSVVVVALAVPLTIVTASMAGFAMALLERRVRGALLVLSVALLLVPVTALWLTRFLLLSWIGLTDTLAALVLPALAGSSPLFVLIYYWTFRRAHPEVFEMAHLDGAGPLGTWWRVAMPNAWPSTVAVAVLTFILYWNDFISPLLYLRDQDLYTLPLGLRQLQQLDPTGWPVMMAGAVMLTLPAVLFFLVVGRLFLGERGLGRE
ncbi:MAG: carbohydrate ABC transporter permease [Candidatus Limnocylindrales bacterium]